MSEIPEIGGRRPMVVNAEAGKSYWWCACGRSKSQPLCDGSRCFYFLRVPLAVQDRERVETKSLGSRDRRRRVRVQAAAEKHHCI